MYDSVERFNKLLKAYLHQVNRVYPLPTSIKNQLSSIVASQSEAIWVVDDDPNDQLFIKVALKSIRPSLPVLTFNDGEALLEKIIQTKTFPKIIILDLNMPRVNGMDALEKLRSNKLFDALCVVILTGSTRTSSRDCVKALALGANHFYTKPSSYADLVALVKTITATGCDLPQT